MRWIEGFGVQRFASEIECSVVEAVGMVVTFLASTQQNGIEAGAHSQIGHYFVGQSAERGKIIDALCRIGVLARNENDSFDIVPNQGLKARQRLYSERGKKARAMVGKTVPVKKKAARKVAEAPGQPPSPARELELSLAGAADDTPQGLELRRQAWAAYSAAYERTTQQKPLSNMKSRSLMKQFCQQIGADAPAVLDFYCRHPNRKYITAVYSLQMALYDASGLHTQWKNNQYVTFEGAKSAGFDAEFLHRMDRLDDEYAQLGRKD